MSKIIVEEFNVCHKFYNKIQLDCLKKFDHFSITHYVADNDFSIFVEFEPCFNIKEIIKYIKKAAAESDLYSYHWKVHRPLVDTRETSFADRKKENCISFSAM